MKSIGVGEPLSDLDDLMQLTENTANMLRGMTLDQSIPEHAKLAMWTKIVELEAAVEKLRVCTSG